MWLPWMYYYSLILLIAQLQVDRDRIGIGPFPRLFRIQRDENLYETPGGATIEQEESRLDEWTNLVGSWRRYHSCQVLPEVLIWTFKKYIIFVHAIQQVRFSDGVST